MWSIKIDSSETEEKYSFMIIPDCHQVTSKFSKSFPGLLLRKLIHIEKINSNSEYQQFKKDCSGYYLRSKGIKLDDCLVGDGDFLLELGKETKIKDIYFLFSNFEKFSKSRKLSTEIINDIRTYVILNFHKI